MPKIVHSGKEVPTPFKNNIHSLKRNQACHQCRRRKLKCDAKRPCSTCVRSHAYAQTHASPSDRLNLPEHPDCTYDDVSAIPPPQQVPAAPKSRYERLENRINELESLLRDKSVASSPSDSSQGSSQVVQTPVSSSNDFGVLSLYSSDEALPPTSQISEDWSNALFGASTTDESSTDFSHFTGSGSLEQLAGIASLLSPPATTQEQPNASTPSSSHGHSGSHSSSPAIPDKSPSIPADLPSTFANQVVYLSWPANLPDMSTTRHLINAFFTHYIHANRMFHAPTFYASLDLHPLDPRFPSKAVLHAMCAVGSLYASSLSPQEAITESYPYDAITGIKRKGQKRIATFGDQQAKFAKEAIEDDYDHGEKLFENAQAQAILAWFMQSHARWFEACLCTAMAVRATIPCALNVCPPFHGITAADPFSEKPPTILGGAKTVIEDEMRRNSFWVAYCLERQIGAGNGWAMLMDDRDVAQLLPLRVDQFQKGTLVLPPDRQWSHGKDTLYVNPSEQCDSFVMYVKCSLLLSKIKNFNLRYKALAFAGDPGMAPNADPVVDLGAFKISPRTTTAFLELDNLLLTFKNKFPTNLKNPITDGKLDYYLYSAWNILHLSHILLHEPYAKPGSQSCLSAFKILTACRAIVTLLHQITSSSFDVSLLDIFPYLCWFMAGRVLVRFLKAAQDAQAEEQESQLKTEINFIRTMLSRAGERMPIAFTYAKLLTQTATATCGDIEAEEQPLVHPVSKNVTWISPQYDYTTSLFQYKTPEEPPQPTHEQMMIISQHTAIEALF